MRTLIMAVLILIVTMLAGCLDTTASRLLIESVEEEEQAWISFGDPRKAKVFSMPISYNPTPPQIGDVRDVVVHIRYGDTQPVTDFLHLRVVGGIELIGEEGVEFFRYTEADEELVFGSIGSPKWCGGPDYYFPIPPSKIVLVQFRITEYNSEKGFCGGGINIAHNYRLEFAVTRTGSEGELAHAKQRHPDAKSLRVTGGTTVRYPVDRYDMLTAQEIPAHWHPSQWGILTPERIATLEEKPTDATIPPKTRLYNTRWNAELALALEDYLLFSSLIERYREMHKEEFPNARTMHDEGYWAQYIGYFARWAFPNDYPPAHIIAKYPMVDIEGGWPQ